MRCCSCSFETRKMSPRRKARAVATKELREWHLLWLQKSSRTSVSHAQTSAGHAILAHAQREVAESAKGTGGIAARIHA